MTAMFDIRTIRNIVALPIRFVLGIGTDGFEARAPRTPLVMRWRRGEDGKLESHWERDE